MSAARIFPIHMTQRSSLLRPGGELVMIDSGAGRSAARIMDNIKSAGLDPHGIKTLVLTHCHIDHIGGAPYFKRELGCRLVIHELDADCGCRWGPCADRGQLVRV